jgi:predicted hotdog family 3-hydroxylacyl-ACP dehydratase|tara:strand:+ start:1275 stop:1706 length:432 start_codon:yes stop_codon:yes gene_type:complete
MILLEKPILNIENLIPQKTPFVMVDSLLGFSNTNVLSSFKILENNIFYENQTLSEAGLVENMAQTIALHTGYHYFLKGQPAPTGYIGSIKEIQILRLPKLYEIINTEARILQEFMGVTLVEITVSNAEKEKIASGTMKTVIAS